MARTGTERTNTLSFYLFTAGELLHLPHKARFLGETGPPFHPLAESCSGSRKMASSAAVIASRRHLERRGTGQREATTTWPTPTAGRRVRKAPIACRHVTVMALRSVATCSPRTVGRSCAHGFPFSATPLFPPPGRTGHAAQTDSAPNEATVVRRAEPGRPGADGVAAGQLRRTGLRGQPPRRLVAGAAWRGRAGLLQGRGGAGGAGPCRGHLPLPSASRRPRLGLGCAILFLVVGYSAALGRAAASSPERELNKELEAINRDTRGLLQRREVFRALLADLRQGVLARRYTLRFSVPVSRPLEVFRWHVFVQLCSVGVASR